jgi:hypothetical protein
MSDAPSLGGKSQFLQHSKLFERDFDPIPVFAPKEYVGPVLRRHFERIIESLNGR